MQVRIDDGDPTPPYAQLRRQLLALVHSGALPAGARLPPIRQLAADLGVAAGTVARAYRELEDSGHLVSRRGGGTRVAEDAVPIPVPPAVLAQAEELVRCAREHGVGAGTVRVALDRALARAGP
ncbi:GntR family transcriptional regulator [Ruania suaedae]|uniref:GntR family transcriptional regulator n=1 Tax=Ruania suaedae TaxID=2897774 RepID=UPI001E450F28|nr:GntR family transcriptional regulator [Ruania suaedae]UFU02344.1 GntR family transcriptional regulator [Ruania suaedae]